MVAKAYKNGGRDSRNSYKMPENKFLEKLQEIKKGISLNGIACFMINSNIREMSLEDTFTGWEILKSGVSEQKYDISRENFISHLHTAVVTYVVRWKGEDENES